MVAFVEIPKMTSITVVDVDINAHLVIVVSIKYAQPTVPPALPPFVKVAVSIYKQTPNIAVNVIILALVDSLVNLEIVFVL